MYNKNTYTFGTLKQGIYKALEEYSLNGNSVSLADGMLADTEKRFLAALNMCARRVSLGLPYLTKRATVVFESGKAKAPADCGSVISIKTKNGNIVSSSHIDLIDGKICCNVINEGEEASVLYRVLINTFTGDTSEDEIINLPDVSADALVYLTAAELCPTEYSELYSRLMYKYRDIALNCYNIEKKPDNRNTFYAVNASKFKR